MSLKGRSILEAQVFTPDIFGELYERTTRMLDAKPQPIFRDDVVVMLFYQPSTRTRMSFQIAAVRLYTRAGFCEGPAFGEYALMAPQFIETSVFFEKRVGGPAA